jgi:ribosome-binding factor A
MGRAGRGVSAKTRVVMTDWEERRGRRPRRDRSRASASLEDKWFRSKWSDPDVQRGRPDRRARQLCRQVREHLELALGELDDPELDGIALLAVEQEPGGRTLRADVLVPAGRDLARVHARLDGVRGWLRSEIAAAIHRKRTPELGFSLIPADALHGPDPGGEDGA